MSPWYHKRLMASALFCVAGGFALMYAALLWHLFRALQGGVAPRQVWQSIAALWDPRAWVRILRERKTHAPLLLNLAGLLLVIAGAILGWIMTTGHMSA